MVDVSVIIPVFNRINTIGRAIESVLNQSFDGSIEIIVSDDGSTDGTIEFVKSNYLNKVVLVEKNVDEKGASAARNRGIKEAHGAYVCFLDSDDFYKQNFVTDLYTACHSEPGIGYAFCRVNKLIKRNDKCIETIWTRPRLNKLAIMYHVLYSSYCINTISIMISKKILDKVGFFDTSLRVGEDSDMWLRISEISEGRFVDVVGSIYCIAGFSGNQLTSVQSDKNQCAILVMEKALHRYKMLQLKDKVRLFLIHRNLYMMKTTQKAGVFFFLYRQISVAIKLLFFCPLCTIKFLWKRIYA